MPARKPVKINKKNRFVKQIVEPIIPIIEPVGQPTETVEQPVESIEQSNSVEYQEPNIDSDSETEAQDIINKEFEKDILKINYIEKKTLAKIRNRPKRNVLTHKNRLNFDHEPGYNYRVFNDKEDRIERAVESGWEVVRSDSIAGGDTRVGADSQLGSPVIRSVGRGVKGVLMRIPDDIYNQYQKEKQGNIDKTEEQMKKPKIAGSYGVLSIEQKQ